MLASLGVASAQAIAWATGCGGGQTPVRRAEPEASGEVRTWLRDAIAALAGAGLGEPHALAVARGRTTAASDVLGASVARGRCAGAVLSATDRGGVRREQVTGDLSQAGIAAAVKALAGATPAPARVAFAPPQVWGAIPVEPDDAALLERARQLAHDRAMSSRIVYWAGAIDVDDATLWAIAPDHDREQRLVRVRCAATRVAWNGTRPVVAEASRAWSGGVAEHELDEDEREAASRAALALYTPSPFEPGEFALVLEPSVTAAVIDAAVPALLTASAARRPEVARRLAVGASVASPLVTLVDDPTIAGAYGGFHFDDLGAPAAAIPLVDAGRVVGRIGPRLRPGHIGPADAAPSHLRLAPGDVDHEALRGEGYLLEGGLGAMVDPSSDRVVISIARARQLHDGQTTGRTYADLELVGELGPLLASVSGVSKQTASFGLRDERDGLPRWRSIEAPWLRATGRLRARSQP